MPTDMDHYKFRASRSLTLSESGNLCSFEDGDDAVCGAVFISDGWYLIDFLREYDTARFILVRCSSCSSKYLPKRSLDPRKCIVFGQRVHSQPERYL